ncbi:metal-dependent transcriptional regulator [Haloglomus halophilum]|jgi:DtxR family Mn-dependent transcriptional regulator|uniref:metal-dependent transcriptional regulator n=1 Tax=Haloglomus halophilum TaxID=2962672 RepID=UPI0020C9A2B2|nr:metal-dependent transcriptional regulator [Haloglomus halophilum]
MSGRGEYVLALYIAEHQGEPPVSPGQVAERLGRSPATASEMFRKLGDDGLVDYEPYEGVALTEAGRARATELHETYVLLSWFFRAVLDLDDHEGKAMEMAAVMDHEVAAQLVETLPYDAEVPPELEVPDRDDDAEA